MRRRLLAPTRIYVKSVLKLLDRIDVRGMATLPVAAWWKTCPASSPDGKLAALVRLDAWQRPSVFDWLQKKGNIDEREMPADVQLRHRFRALRGPGQAEEAAGLLNGSGESVVEIGEIVYRSAGSGAGELLLAPGLPYTLKAS